MIEKLTDSNCIKFGEFKLKNGETSNYYCDIKNIIAYPKILKEISDSLYTILEEFDVICGVPYGALPLAVYIATKYNKKLIYIRSEKKAYGTQKLIEGEYSKNDRCVIIDDVLTTGRSIEKDYNILKDLVTIVDKAVVVNRSENYDIKSLIDKKDLDKYFKEKYN